MASDSRDTFPANGRRGESEEAGKDVSAVSGSAYVQRHGEAYRREMVIMVYLQKVVDARRLILLGSGKGEPKKEWLGRRPAGEECWCGKARAMTQTRVPRSRIGY